MPGKHAPESSASFIMSLARAVGGALAAVAVMTILVVALLNRGSNGEAQGPTVSPPPSSRTPTASPSPKTTPSTVPTPTVLAPAKVTVQVLNGTQRVGLAARTSDEIRKQGYKVTGTGNTAATQKSTIFYRKGRKAEALAFQQLFPDFTVLKEAPASQATILKVVLGGDWPAET